MLLGGGLKLNGINDLFVAANSPNIELSPIEFVFVVHLPMGMEPEDKEKVLL